MRKLSDESFKKRLIEPREMEKIPTITLVVAGALRDEAGRWLMHRRPLHKHHGGLWEFPGGKVESEEFPRVALARELSEELDIDAAPCDMKPVAFADSDADEAQNPIVILLYKLRHWQGEPRAIEGEEVAWFAPSEIATLDKPPLDVELARQLFDKLPG